MYTTLSSLLPFPASLIPSLIIALSLQEKLVRVYLTGVVELLVAVLVLSISGSTALLSAADVRWTGHQEASFILKEFERVLP